MINVLSRAHTVALVAVCRSSAPIYHYEIQNILNHMVMKINRKPDFFCLFEEVNVIWKTNLIFRQSVLLIQFVKSRCIKYIESDLFN